MEHLDAELLSLMALGEPLGPDADADHLANCPQCRETLRSLQHAVHVATLDLADIELEAPGSQTWTAIHQALGLSPELAADPLSRRAAGPSMSSSPPAGPAVADTPQQRGTEPQAAPIPLRHGAKKRQARPRFWLTAAAAGIVLGVAAGWTAAGVLERPGTPAPISGPSVPAPVVLAQTSLTLLPTHTGSGDAQVQQLPDGTRRLTVRLSNEHISGFRGVWVGSADLSKMVSLGVLANDSGVFTIPAGIDLAQYPVVDVSDQPYNGNPAHSADSIARGTLNPKT
jgi:hypothetical protein